MGDPESGYPDFHGMWQPAHGFEPGISSDDDEDNDLLQPAAMALTGYRKRTFQGSSQGAPRKFGRFQGNARWREEDATEARESYWSSTGPKLESKKLLNCTLELPKVAPASAPPEDKKLILSQTKDKIAEAGTGDWQAKYQLLAQQFVVAVPNAVNEAKVRLAKLRNWTSDVYEFGPHVGLGVGMVFADRDDTTTLKYISCEMRIHPRRAPEATNPVPNLPNERCIQVPGFTTL